MNSGKAVKKILVTLVVVVMALMGLPGLALAQPPDSLEFYQLNFKLDGTITLNSDWGAVDLAFTGSPDILYFNLTINGSWQIQNIPVLSIEGASIAQSQRFWFDLGNNVGEDVTSLNYAYALTTHTLASMPAGSTLALVGEDWVVVYNSGASVPFNNVPPLAGPVVGGPVADPKQHGKPNFPNQQAGPYECAPTAVSNSLKALKAWHNLPLNDADITIEKMKDACGFVPNWGCPRDTWWSLKRDYMTKHNLPISTRRFPATDIGKIAAEIDSCQDIEMELFGHTVAVVGIADLGGGKYQVTVAHDGDQDDPNGGTKVEHGKWDGNKWEGDLAPYAGLNYFVVECPVPPPPPTGGTMSFLADSADSPARFTGGPDSSPPLYAIIGAAVAALAALVPGGWFARRRWLLRRHS